MRAPFPIAAFTLFEVAISLAIIAVAVTGSTLVLTGGLKAQEASRFRLYAAAKAIEMADVYAQADHQFLRQSYEAEELGRSPFTWNQTDLERALQGGWYGTLVLPDAIARRLDSDNDEIAQLLSAGGKLFYASPRPAMAANGEGGEYYTKGWTGIDLRLATEAQKLVIGVVGPAQQDALLCHPCLGWPYHSFYPSPPDLIYGEAKGWRQDTEVDAWEVQQREWTWPGLAEMRAVALAARPDPADLAGVQAYIDACHALIIACGVAVDPTPGGDVPRLPAALPTPPWGPTDIDVFPPPWRVLAIRYLANAALMRTGDRLPAANPAEQDYAAATHEAALAWAHRYARSDPYDWGANRIVQEMSTMDYPLLQFDLFSPPHAVDDGAGGIDRSWLVSTARPARNFARARGYDGLDALLPENFAKIASSWGDPAHFTLTDRFAASARTRQLVFWAVDWQAYDDFESTPTATFDAKQHNLDSRGVYVRHQDMLANPERELVWREAAHQNAGFAALAGNTPGDLPSFPQLTVGAFGADRNGNDVFDRGPLPISSRMRATSVARYNFYDKRILASLRN